jgi:RNA polymerase sigma factor (sigma-70 family)
MAAAHQLREPLSWDHRIMSLERLVFAVVNYMIQRVPASLRADVLPDLVQVGWLGAIGAVEKHDPTRSEFGWYAKRHIIHVIQDYMRSVDHLPRSDRRCVKANEYESPRRIRGYPTSPSPLEAIILRHDLQRLLQRARLPRRYMAVLWQYYWGDETMETIGVSLALTKGRVSQIHTEAIRRLRIASVNVQ